MGLDNLRRPANGRRLAIADPTIEVNWGIDMIVRRLGLLCRLGIHRWCGCECVRCGAERHDWRTKTQYDETECSACNGVGALFLDYQLCPKCGTTGRVKRQLPGTQFRYCVKCLKIEKSG